MKLILHIGTPKTGTTAVQRFLYANRETLPRYGLHYATPHRSEHANSIANALHLGDTRAVHTFLAKHTKAARRYGASAVVVSSENFYARNVLVAMQGQQPCPGALERDRRFIAMLRALIPEDVESFHVACYLRRPDRYAESLYNQHVKRGTIDGCFSEFLSLIEPALSYDRCMRPWADVFGQANCIVRLYDTVRADIVNDFMTNVLGIRDASQFVRVREHTNERISRDVLEFKRLRNRTARFSERAMESAIIRLVDKQMQSRTAASDLYQDFLSPDERAELLERLQPELDALRASYAIPEFPVFDLETAKASWRPYPGLRREREREIQWRYDRINRRTAFRLERMTLRLAGLLRRGAPWTGVLLDASKRLGAKRALHGLAVGVQRGSR
jgi:hypothetical protein